MKPTSSEIVELIDCLKECRLSLSSDDTKPIWASLSLDSLEKLLGALRSWYDETSGRIYRSHLPLVPIGKRGEFEGAMRDAVKMASKYAPSSNPQLIRNIDIICGTLAEALQRATKEESQGTTILPVQHVAGDMVLGGKYSSTVVGSNVGTVNIGNQGKAKGHVTMGTSQGEEGINIDRQKNTMTQGIQLFISHSAQDVNLATTLIHCIEACLIVPDKSIRCTSVKGYTLDPGDPSDIVLRDNLEQCSMVIGLLTENSLKSMYVIMELGAAWGLKKPTCALLHPAISFSRIPDLIRRLHAIKSDSDADIANLMELLEKRMGWKAKNHAKYTAAVNTFVAAAKASS